MKKTVLFLLCLLLLSGCAREEIAPAVSAGELTALLVQECGVEGASLLDRSETLKYLGLEDGVCTDAAGFQALDTALPQLGFILVCPDAESEKEAEQALEALLQQRLEQCRSYSPADLAVTEKCRVEHRGAWLSLFISTKHEQQEAFFASAFTAAPLPALKTAPKPTPIPAQPSTAPEPAASQRVDDSWFDDALFVGDSIADAMRIYAEHLRTTGNPECMGSVTFFCMQNFSYARAADDNIHNLEYFPIYQGRARRVETVVELTGCKKLLVEMGANELSGDGAEGTAENVEKLMQLCLEVNPELEIYLMNLLPCVYEDKPYGIDNRMIKEFNASLRELCEEKGYHYLDIYSALANEEGLMNPEDCADPLNAGVHPNLSGCEKWLNYLYEHCG